MRKPLTWLVGMSAVAGGLAVAAQPAAAASHHSAFTARQAVVADPPSGAVLDPGSGALAVTAPIESMPIWRLQLEVTTANTNGAGTNGIPAVRLNGTAAGVQQLNPRSFAAFDQGHVDTYDLRPVRFPSEITMLRLGIPGSDNWCVSHVKLRINNRLAFDSDAASGGGCVNITQGGHNLEFSFSDLRSNVKWRTYGPRPPLPTRLSAADLRSMIEGATGSAIAPSGDGLQWNPFAVGQLTLTRPTSNVIRVSSPTLPSFSYDLQLFVGADGKLHVFQPAPTGAPRDKVVAAVTNQLSLVLARMTNPPLPHGPLHFSVDSASNITWTFVPMP